MIHLQRDGLGLLMGSFYAPTGIFAILAMTSYVINPDAVSYILAWALIGGMYLFNVKLSVPYEHFWLCAMLSLTFSLYNALFDRFLEEWVC